MHSTKGCSITSGEVHGWALESLLQANLAKDDGWRCTAAVLLNIVVRAAARSDSPDVVPRLPAGKPKD